MTINTVLGSKLPEELGLTMMHEHLLVRQPGADLDPQAVFDRAQAIANCTDQLKALREFGVQTLVDPLPMELGRDPELMAEVSQRSGVNIICSTGFFNEDRGIPVYWRFRSVDEIEDLFLHDIENGIGPSKIKPGLIKVSTGLPKITELEMRIIEAACRAQRRTGLPITTHTDGGLLGPEQQDAFAHFGVSLSRCIIGHSCQNPNVSYHIGMAERGSYVGFDRVSLSRYQSDEVRAETISKFVKEGYIQYITMSQDLYCYWQGELIQFLDLEARKSIAELKSLGKWPKSMTHLFKSFVPMLIKKGLTEQDIDTILIENPRRYFGGVAPQRQSTR